MKILMTLLPMLAITSLAANTASAKDSKGSDNDGWAVDFGLEKCKMLDQGSNMYFVLEPGFELVLKGTEDEDTVELIITVLDETVEVDGIRTRVVEERESVNGELVEISLNFFAICKENNSVFYYGEDVDIYKDGEVVGHEGAWRAGVDSARAGLMIPGSAVLGSGYYQEIAPGIAMDRARIVSVSDSLQTPAGKFVNCLKTEETNPLEPEDREFKYYAPEIGLIKDGDLLLVSYGFKKR